MYMEGRTEPEDNGRLQTLKQFKNVNGSVIIDVKAKMLKTEQTVANETKSET